MRRYLSSFFLRLSYLVTGRVKPPICTMSRDESIRRGLTEPKPVVEDEGEVDRGPRDDPSAHADTFQVVKGPPLASERLTAGLPDVGFPPPDGIDRYLRMPWHRERRAAGRHGRRRSPKP